MSTEELRELDLQMVQQLSRIEESLKAMHKRFDELVGKQAEMERRIKALESGQLRIAGAASVIAVLAGWVVPHVIKVLMP